MGIHLKEKSNVLRGQNITLKERIEFALSPIPSPQTKARKLPRRDYTKLTSEEFGYMACHDQQLYLTEMAQWDPYQALQLIRESKTAARSSLLKAFSQAGQTADERTEILEAMRSVAQLEDDLARQSILQREVMIGLARSHSDESFQAIQTWMEAAALTREEKEQFAAGLLYENVKEDPARWMEWLAENVSPRKIAGVIGDLMGQWTQQDYLAAGNWLAQQPDGLTRSAAVRSYAVTVAPYEPETAAQWAQTLPLGKERDSTLEKIHSSWPLHDAAGAAAFAIAHGIKH